MQPKKIIRSLAELPTMPSSIGTMEWNQTGDWRFLTPVVADKPAPCRRDCPAGIPIPYYLRAINQGDIQTGLALLLALNPLPGLSGRLCYHPCQTNCTRKKIDGPIAIRDMERFLAELGPKVRSHPNRRSDKRVTVIGSGPLGLSCAYFLGCGGLKVTVLEGNGRAGGGLAGLPEKTIEPGILEEEIRRLIRIADIRLETGAGFDVNRPESLSDPDLLILDPTASLNDFPAAAGSVPFNPFGEEDLSGHVIAVTLPENLKPFKAPLIAHYIAAGRRTAEKVFNCLMGGSEFGTETSIFEPVKQEEKREGPPITDASLSVLTVDEGAKQTEKGAGEWIFREAGRCLGCGSCNLCIQCLASCPEACIRLDDGRTGVTVDLDFCKGCGLCAYECPRGVITMEEVGP